MKGSLLQPLLEDWQSKFSEIWANYTDQTGGLVTPNGRLATEFPQNAFSSGLGIIVLL